MDQQDSKPPTPADVVVRGSWVGTAVWLLTVAWFGTTLVAVARVTGSLGVLLTEVGLALLVVLSLGWHRVARPPMGTGASFLVGAVASFPAWIASEATVATSGVVGFVVVMTLLPALGSLGDRRQRIASGLACMVAAVLVLVVIAVGLRQLGAVGGVLPLFGPAGRLLLWTVEGLPRLG